MLWTGAGPAWKRATMEGPGRGQLGCEAPATLPVLAQPGSSFCAGGPGASGSAVKMALTPIRTALISAACRRFISAATLCTVSGMSAQAAVARCWRRMQVLMDSGVWQHAQDM